MPEWRVPPWRPTLRSVVTRVRTGGRAAVLWSMRITAAAVASYVVATLFFPGSQPLLAPLTAMLVVQVTPVSLLASGLDRVLAVVAGVSLAVVFGSVVPLRWWSLGLLILTAITIGQALRLRSNLIEVAISGMLVLGVGSLGAEAAAWQRVAETLVGAAVGIAANLLFPPKVATADAGQAIDGLADSVSELLTRAADQLADLLAAGEPVAPSARNWLGDARRITHEIPSVGAALLHAEQGRRFNVRAVGTPDVGPGLRQGLESLEHCAIAIRGMFRALVDATQDEGWPDDEGSRELLEALAETLRAMAAGVDAFGQLVRNEADATQRVSSSDVQAVREAVSGLHAARERLEQLFAGAGPQLLELHAVVLSTTKRLTAELDLGERVRRQVRSLRETRRGRPAGQPAAPRDTGAPTSWEPGPDEETQLLPQRPRDRGPGRPPA